MKWDTYREIMKRSREKYLYYDGHYDFNDFDSSKTARLLSYSRIGWGRRAIEMRANKTHFDTFENDTIGLNEVFNELRGPQAFNKIKDDILVGGVSFLALSGDRVMPFTSEEATGTYDWSEQNLGDGVAIFDAHTQKNSTRSTAPDSYVIYKKDSTEEHSGNISTITRNKTGRPLMVALTHKSTTKQPFGHTVLSRPARDAIKDASRTNRQATIAGYHYNSKVDVLLGVDVETDVKTIERKSGDTLLVGSNENGQIPQLGQFAQHAMAPFGDSIMMYAKNFCADTKLSLSNLGYASDAPESPEALQIVGDDLRDDIAEWQQELGEQLKYFAVTLYMNKFGIDKIDANLQEKIDAIEVAWKPIYVADVAKFGDAIGKIAQYAPEFLRQRSTWRRFGLTSKEIDDVIDSLTTNSQT